MERYYVINDNDASAPTRFEREEVAIAHFGSREEADRDGIPVYMAEDRDAEIAKLKEALHTLYGQVDQAREGFGIYAASNTMDAAMAAAKEVLKL